VFAAKTQAESAMAIRSDWMQLPVFVAQKSAPHKQAITRSEDISHAIRLSIRASRTLSANPVIINRWKEFRTPDQ